MSGSRCRLAILASHPIQYFTPVYRRLAQDARLDVDVMYYRDYGVKPRFDEQFGRMIQWDTDQLSGYQYRFLANISPVTNTFNPLHAINPGAFTRLLSGYDAVWLNGYTYPSNWFAASAARISNTALLLRSELRVETDRPRRWRDGVRDRIIRRWVSRSDALLYIGEENRRAYDHYGARPEQLFFTPYSADVAGIRATMTRLQPRLRELRSKFGVLPNRTVLLFAGKLTPRKHPEAFLKLAVDPDLADRVHLLVAGSGPLLGELEEFVQDARARNVTFLGFVNQSKLPEVYSVADVFVMPSEREPWGIVVNEAMAAGAVPVVSDAVGAAADLVIPMSTGLQFPVRDWNAMRDAVKRVVLDADLRHQLASNGAARAENYDHDRAAAGVIHALTGLGLIPQEVGETAPDKQLAVD